MKLLITQLSPVTSSLFGPNILFGTLVLKHPQSVFPPLMSVKKLYTHTKAQAKLYFTVF
jgi:hypothetical protein